MASILLIPSPMDPSQQGFGTPQIHPASGLLWLQQPGHWLAWASWERKGKSLLLLPMGPVSEVNFSFISTSVAQNSALGYARELPWCLEAGWSGDDAGCE